jgi:hypothetical protein
MPLTSSFRPASGAVGNASYVVAAVLYVQEPAVTQQTQQAQRGAGSQSAPGVLRRLPAPLPLFCPRWAGPSVVPWFVFVWQRSCWQQCNSAACSWSAARDTAQLPLFAGPHLAAGVSGAGTAAADPQQPADSINTTSFDLAADPGAAQAYWDRLQWVVARHGSLRAVSGPQEALGRCFPFAVAPEVGGKGQDRTYGSGWVRGSVYVSGWVAGCQRRGLGAGEGGRMAWVCSLGFSLRKRGGALCHLQALAGLAVQVPSMQAMDRRCCLPAPSRLHALTNPFRPPPQCSFDRAFYHRKLVTTEQFAQLDAFLAGRDAAALTAAQCREVADCLGMPLAAVRLLGSGCGCVWWWWCVGGGGGGGRGLFHVRWKGLAAHPGSARVGGR